MTLGSALMRHQGAGGPGGGTAPTPGRASCASRSATRRSSFRCCGGCVLFYRDAGSVTDGTELGEQLLRLAQRLHDPALAPASTHYALGGDLVLLGELPAARTHLAQGIALYDPQPHHALAFRYWHGPRCDLLAPCGPTPVVPGLSDAGPPAEPRGATLAQELAHPYSLALRWSGRPWLHQFRREDQPRTSRQRPLTLATEQGFAHSGWPGARSCTAGRWPAGPGRGGPGADPPGARRLAGHRGRCPAV